MMNLGFRDHFSDRAAGYREYRPTYPRELIDFLADTAPGTSLAWEAGCGSGQLSFRLVERFDRVVAIDPSAEQLSYARRHERIEYRQALAQDSGLADQTADLAVAAQAAHWFDLDAYYAEVRRVARRGALVALVCYDLLSAGDDVDPIISHFYCDVLAPYWPWERSLVEAGYRTIPFPFDEIPAPALQLRADWTLDQFLGYARTWSGVRAMERARGPGAIEALGERLAPLWGDGGGATRCITWPLAMRLGRVR